MWSFVKFEGIVTKGIDIQPRYVHAHTDHLLTFQSYIELTCACGALFGSSRGFDVMAIGADLALPQRSPSDVRAAPGARAGVLDGQLLELSESPFADVDSLVAAASFDDSMPPRLLPGLSGELTKGFVDEEHICPAKGATLIGTGRFSPASPVD